jgi:hypothetical protein
MADKNKAESFHHRLNLNCNHDSDSIRCSLVFIMLKYMRCVFPFPSAMTHQVHLDHSKRSGAPEPVLELEDVFVLIVGAHAHLIRFF